MASAESSEKVVRARRRLNLAEGEDEDKMLQIKLDLRIGGRKRTKEFLDIVLAHLTSAQQESGGEHFELYAEQMRQISAMLRQIHGDKR